ncbi:MAG: hypothetical protein AAGA88_05810 [Pseudomonadota bacterium]
MFVSKIAGALFVIGSLLFASPEAYGATLSGDQIRDRIVNRTIYLRIPTGGEFPLQYRSNGQVTGDGTKVGLARFFAPKETGKWWIDGNRMCQQFPTWYRGRTFCFTLQDVGSANRLGWTRDDGRSGVARVE